MPRELDTSTLDLAARHYAANFLHESVFSEKHPAVAILGKEYVFQCLYNADFKDEHDYLVAAMKEHMGPATLKEFEAEAKKRFSKRDPKVFAAVLADKLAIDPDGQHIPGKVGKVIVGSRKVGVRTRVMKNGQAIAKDARWNIYAGEDIERAAESDAVDALPDADTVFEGQSHLNPV